MDTFSLSCRLFDAMRPLRRLLLLLDIKEATYVFAYPCAFKGIHFFVRANILLLSFREMVRYDMVTGGLSLKNNGYCSKELAPRLVNLSRPSMMPPRYSMLSYCYRTGDILFRFPSIGKKSA